MLKKWQNGQVSGVFESQIATAHLKSLAGDFNQELSGLPLPLQDDPGNVDPASQSSSIQDQRSEDSDDTIPEDNRSAEELRRCLDAHIKLQVLLVTQRAIPVKTVQDFIEILDDRRDSDKMKTGDDSGNSTSHSTLSADHPRILNPRNPKTGSYSASLLKSINGATDVVSLTERCLDPLLEFVRKAIFRHPVRSYEQWEGSFLMKFCDSLAEWCEYPVCRRKVSQFVDETLLQLWPCDQMPDDFNLEFQLAILSSVNRHPDLCSSTLDKLVLQISKEITKLVKSSAEPFDWQISAVVHFLDFADLLFDHCQPEHKPNVKIRLPRRDLFISGDHLPQEFKQWNIASLCTTDEARLTDRLQWWHEHFSQLALTVVDSPDCPTMVYQRLLDGIGKIEILLHRSRSSPDCLPEHY
ncbi:Hypothetical protein NTJ_06281 [Nesidiocoris tenuis]|nr:Hypothetical protein NTJ_06281 [Nesidiocoris tenuis]